MPLTAVVPESPFAWPIAKRIEATSVTPGTSRTVLTTSAGIGLKPSWFWTTSAAFTWSSIVFVIARLADTLIRGQLGAAFEPSWYAVLFHGENLFVLAPALVLLHERFRNTPRILFVGAAITAIGGLVYRFSPTTLAFRYGRSSIYFPSTGELLMCLGYIALAVALFIVAVRRFAILPDRISD